MLPCLYMHKYILLNYTKLLMVKTRWDLCRQKPSYSQNLRCKRDEYSFISLEIKEDSLKGKLIFLEIKWKYDFAVLKSTCLSKGTPSSLCFMTAFIHRKSI